MISMVLEVDPRKSYVKSLGWPSTKPNVSMPLIVPISSGNIDLKIDEKKNIGNGKGSVNFVSDKFSKSQTYNITGGLQTITVFLQTMEIEFNPATGELTNFGGHLFVMGQPFLGGAGSLAYWYQGPSSLIDGNSPSFDISDGLGCGGGLIYEVGVGNPTNFIVHIEATVISEDANGDGIFETTCPGIFWKSLHLEYDPPWIKIVIPEMEDMIRAKQFALPLRVAQSIKFTDLWKSSGEGEILRRERARIDSIELIGGKFLSLVLTDSKGNVIGGSVHNKRTRSIKVPSIDLEDLYLTVFPHRGVGTVRFERPRK